MKTDWLNPPENIFTVGKKEGPSEVMPIREPGVISDSQKILYPMSILPIMDGVYRTYVNPHFILEIGWYLPGFQRFQNGVWYVRASTVEEAEDTTVESSWVVDGTITTWSYI